jgi:hypothetical protein
MFYLVREFLLDKSPAQEAWAVGALPSILTDPQVDQRSQRELTERGVPY